MSDLLDCGHPPSPHDPTITTGYAVDSETGKKSCYPCAWKWEQEHFRATGRMTAYCKDDAGIWRITSWGGEFLRNPPTTDFPEGIKVYITRLNSRRIGGWTSRDLHYIAFWWEGHRWTGTTHGPGIYLRARRCKDKKP